MTNTINELKKELGFKTKAKFNAFIANTFSFKSVAAFENSSARKRYEKALCLFYEKIKSKEQNNM